MGDPDGTIGVHGPGADQYSNVGDALHFCYIYLASTRYSSLQSASKTTTCAVHQLELSAYS